MGHIADLAPFTSTCDMSLVIVFECPRITLTGVSEADPPENCYLTAKKLLKTCHLKKKPKIDIQMAIFRRVRSEVGLVSLDGSLSQFPHPRSDE